MIEQIFSKTILKDDGETTIIAQLLLKIYQFISEFSTIPFDIQNVFTRQCSAKL